jgi:hypothetical protein
VTSQLAVFVMAVSRERVADEVLVVWGQGDGGLCSQSTWDTSSDLRHKVYSLQN